MPLLGPLLAILLALPSWHQDRGEESAAREQRLTMVATAISRATGGDLRRSARLLALGWHESRWARYVGEGRCADGPKGARCDPDRRGVARARTYWQLHYRACPAAWRLPAGSQAELNAAAHCADALLRGALHRCRNRSPAGVEAGAFAGYRGIDCTWRGGAKRARTADVMASRLWRRRQKSD